MGVAPTFALAVLGALILSGPWILRGAKLAGRWAVALGRSASLRTYGGGGLVVVAVILQLLTQARDSPGPAPSDVLAESYSADRAGRVALLRDMAGQDFPSDEAANNWHTEHSRDVLNDAFRPYLDELAEHIVSGTVAEFADELEGGK